MKKSILFSIIAMIALASCQQKEDFTLPVKGELMTFYASIMDDATKTTAQDDGEKTKVLWAKDDAYAMSVLGGDFAKFTLEGEGGETTGTFSGIAVEGGGSQNVAYYPYADGITITDGKLNVVFPAEQAYTENCIAAAPMVAVSEDNTLKFQNVASLVKITLKGTATIKTISLTGNNNEYLAGNANVTLNETPTLTLTSDATVKTIVLNCGEGITLTEDGVDFYFAVPAGTFTHGFTVVATDSEDNTMTKTTTNEVVLGESKVKVLPAFTYEANTTSVSSEVALKTAVETGGDVVLASDITLTSCLEIRNDVNLDLNGHTLTTAEELENDEYSAAIIVYEGDLTVRGGTITSSGTSAHKSMGSIWVRGDQAATVTIKEGTVLKGNNWSETVEGQTDGLATVYVSNPNGYAYIEGGEFYCVKQTQVDGQNQILNYKNEFETQNIVVTGGKFYGMNPDKGNGVEISYLAENAVVVETSAGVFEVLSADTEGVITLNEDLTIVSPMVIDGQDITLNLNGKTLTTAEVISGYSAAIIVYEGNLTVRGGTITNSGVSAHKSMGAIWVRGDQAATVTIKEGTVLKGNNWSETVEGQTDGLATVYVSNPNGYAYIEGGEFYCVKQTQVDGQNQILNYKNEFETQNIVVTGGKFYGMNPEKGNGTEISYLATGYKSTETEENGIKVYTVSAEESN